MEDFVAVLVTTGRPSLAETESTTLARISTLATSASPIRALLGSLSHGSHSRTYHSAGHEYDPKWKLVKVVFLQDEKSIVTPHLDAIKKI